MRISDIDPDEIDDDATHPWRWVVGIAVVAALVGGGVAGWRLLGDDGQEAAPTATVVDVEVIEEPEVEPPVINIEPAPGGFPDWGSDYVGNPIPLLYTRTTETGITVNLQDTGGWNVQFGVNEGGGDEFTVETIVVNDAFVDPVPAAPVPIPPQPPQPDPLGWQAPSYCNPVGGYRLSMTFGVAVGTTQGQRYDGTPAEGVLATLHSSGQAEGRPFRVLVLQVADDVLDVAVTWEDGVVDAAPTVEGWVVLAAPGQPNGVFELTVRTEVGERTVQWSDLLQNGDRRWQVECTPPPPVLPPPGDVQPADPAAAEEEITTKFDLLWNRDIPREDKPDDILDDWTGVQEAVEQVSSGPNGGTASDAQHILTGVVFTSDTEAWFQYDIITPAITFEDRFGVAFFIDGSWRISRSVICQDLALAGAQCVPFAPPIGVPLAD